MNTESLRQWITSGRFPGAKSPIQLIETHISWVILTPDFAFKFKKPVQLGFLDFSSLEQRRFYCEEEVRLNRRLAPDMYLGVLPLRAWQGQWHLGATAPGEVIDYAVHMRRMDEQRQMDVLLQQSAVTTQQIRQLAALLAQFHLKNTCIHPNEQDIALTFDDFDHLFQLQAEIRATLGDDAWNRLQSWETKVARFIERRLPRLRERARAGFWVDGHGDLHTRNIFLLPEGPLVFDCIEFNPHFRQLDVLSELAFLCMDLEYHEHPALSDAFLDAYRRHWSIMPAPEDEALFLYFKAYRANVRLKVALLQAREHETEANARAARHYCKVMENSLHLLSTTDGAGFW